MKPCNGLKRMRGPNYLMGRVTLRLTNNQWVPSIGRPQPWSRMGGHGGIVAGRLCRMAARAGCQHYVERHADAEANHLLDASGKAK